MFGVAFERLWPYMSAYQSPTTDSHLWTYAKAGTKLVLKNYDLDQLIPMYSVSDEYSYPALMIIAGKHPIHPQLPFIQFYVWKKV